MRILEITVPLQNKGFIIDKGEIKEAEIKKMIFNEGDSNLDIFVNNDCIKIQRQEFFENRHSCKEYLETKRLTEIDLKTITIPVYDFRSIVTIKDIHSEEAVFVGKTVGNIIEIYPEKGLIKRGISLLNDLTGAVRTYPYSLVVDSVLY